MKRSIPLLGTLLFFAAAAFSQKSTTFGFKLGLASNYLTFKFDDEELASSNTRPFIGAVVNCRLTENFSIQPNLLLIMKGGMVEAMKINTFHIDVPVNFLYTTNGFFAGGGPNFSYGVVGRLDLGNEDVDVYNQDEAEDLTLKRFDVGANILMGYNFPGGITVAANFTPMLLNTYKGSTEPEDIKGHFKTFAFTVGYMFSHNKK